MPPKLRIEIYIPTHYNPSEDGSRNSIETGKHRELKNEIVDKYGAVSKHSELIEGIWKHPEQGTNYYDTCYKYEVTIDFKDEIADELEIWKEKLKNDFKQFEIYMIYYKVDQV